MDKSLISAYRALRSALCSVIHIPCRPDAGVFFLEILMTAFSKQLAYATRISRATAKQLLARVKLLKHPEVKAAFEAFPPVMRKDINMSLSAYGESVFMNLTIRDLDSFKSPKLTKVLEKFVGDEWTARVNDYPNETPNKDFHFEQRVGGFLLSVSVYAYVKSDSPLCRVVVTGMTERMVREEIREIVCA